MLPRPSCRPLTLALCLLGSTLFAADAPTGPRPPAAKSQKPSLRAGAAAVDISPKQFPINMPGGFSANPASGVHDPLHARALVLDDGTTRLALVVVDILGIGGETLDEAKALAAARSGIAAEKMMVSATHTHSGPASSPTGPAAAQAFHKILVAGIAEAIAQANAALQPASVAAGSHPLPTEVFNRRWYLKPGKMPPNPFGAFDQVKMNPGTSEDVLDRPAGPTDPELSVLSVQDSKRRPLALYANYGLHYVGSPPPGLISADYFGEFARLAPARLRAGDGFVAMMSNGTSGDINNIPFRVVRPPRAPYEQIRLVASHAADAAWHACRDAGAHRQDVSLGMAERRLKLRHRRPTAEQLAAAKTVLAIKDPAAKEKLPRLAESYARATVAAAERAEETVEVVLQAVRVGDVGLCGIPFEVFAEIGLELKKRSPLPRTIVVSLANGRHGYLPTPAQHKLGGYETWLGTCHVEETASVKITDALLTMLAELKN